VAATAERYGLDLDELLEDLERAAKASGKNISP